MHVATSGVVIASLSAIPLVVLTVEGPLLVLVLIQVTVTTRLLFLNQRPTLPTRTHLLVLSLLTASIILAIPCHHKVFTSLLHKLLVTFIGNHLLKQSYQHA